MKACPYSMPNKLPHYRKTMLFCMMLNGSRNIRNSIPNFSLINTFIKSRFRDLEQQSNSRFNCPNRYGYSCISIKTFVKSTKIKRYNIARSKNFSF